MKVYQHGPIFNETEEVEVEELNDEEIFEFNKRYIKLITNKIERD